MISLNSLVVRGTGALAAELDRETVLMSIEHGNYYSLSQTSREVWRRIEHPTRVADLCRDLAAAYGADPATVEGDTVEFLDRLQALKLIDVSG